MVCDSEINLFLGFGYEPPSHVGPSDPHTKNWLIEASPGPELWPRHGSSIGQWIGVVAGNCHQWSRCPWPVHAWGWSICRNEQRTRSSRAHQGGFPNHGVVVPEGHGTPQNHGSDSDFVQVASYLGTLVSNPVWSLLAVAMPCFGETAMNVCS